MVLVLRDHYTLVNCVFQQVTKAQATRTILFNVVNFVALCTFV